MLYQVVVHKDKNSSYGVTVPDIPGCFSAGENYDDALKNAIEAINLMLESMVEDGDEIPTPKSLLDHRDNPDYEGGEWFIVYIDTTFYTKHA